MYKIDIRKTAQRSLDRLQKGDFTAVLEAVSSLAHEPRPRGVEKIKQSDLWRIRQGNYRVIYSIDDIKKLIVILRIGHRREVFRSL
jgi:mRNA interferase RelE/StbE